MRHLNRPVVVSSLLAATLLATACSTDEQPTSADDRSSTTPFDTTIDFVVPDSDFFVDPVRESLGKDFTQETGITVEIVTVEPQFEAADQRVQQDLLAGNPPALAMIGNSSLELWADSGRYVPLDGFADDSSAADEMYPAILDLGRWDGELVAVPYQVGLLTMFYNADLLTAAGLDPDSPPQTWDQLGAAAQAIVDGGHADCGVTWPWNSSGNWPLQNWVLSNNGQLRDGDELTFTAEPVVESVEFWAGLVDSGAMCLVDRDNIPDALARQDVAIAFNSNSIIDTVAEQATYDVRTAPIPIPTGGKRQVAAATSTLAVFSQDSDEQAAAWRVIEELIGTEGSTVATVNSGFLPVNEVAATRVDQLVDLLSEDPLRAAAAEQLPDAVPWQGFPGTAANEISDILRDRVLTALEGANTAESALQAAQQEAEGLLP